MNLTATHFEPARMKRLEQSMGEIMNFYDALKATHEGKTVRDKVTGHRYRISGGYFKLVGKWEDPSDLYFYPIADWMFTHEWEVVEEIK